MERRAKVLGLLALPLLAATFLVTANSFAATRPLDDFCKQVGGDTEVCKADQADKNKGDVGLLASDGIVRRVFDLISWLTGILCGIFIIVGGFKLVTSGGNKDSVKSGKNMIIYAAVGLAVILLSNLIINVIIGFANSASP